MAKYLIDASALYPLILKLREKIFTVIKRFAILDLTFYEVGNVLWKQYKRGKIADLNMVMDFFREILNSLERLQVEDFASTLKIARKENLTFYDAAYIYAAEKHRLVLITADQEILRKYPKAVQLEKLKTPA